MLYARIFSGVVLACAFAVQSANADDSIKKVTEIEVGALPAVIVDRIGKDHPGAELGRATKVDETYYEVELMASSGEVEISFYADGSEVEGRRGGGRRGGGGGIAPFHRLRRHRA